MVSNKLDEWVKIDIELRNKLKILEALNKERKDLIAKAEQSEMTQEIKDELERSVIKYTCLASEVADLKKQAKLLKNKKSKN